MEELLKKIETGLKIESDSLAEAVQKRTAILNQYTDAVRGFIVKLKELSRVQFEEYEKNVLLNENLKKEVVQAREAAASVRAKREEESRRYDEEIKAKQVNVDSLSEKEISLSNKINTRLMEQGNLDESLAALRVSESSYQRSVMSLQAKERALEASIAEKEAKMGEMSTEEMNLKQRVTRLTDMKEKKEQEIKELK